VKVSENRVLRRTFESVKEEVAGVGENYILRSFINLLFNTQEGVSKSFRTESITK
jgi:hypothetical protein